ncbi:MAG: ATP-binding protein [Thermoanaerobaculia bacterium]|nr:ATP-binding protein [Thermoanaerobaculia bacterium]
MDRRRGHSGPPQDSEDFSRALVRAAPIPMFTLAVEDGSLTSTNPAFDAWTGSDPGSGGGFMTSYVHPGDVALFISNLHQAMLGQMPSPFELRMRASGESFQISELSLLPESRDGRLVQILGFVRDVRERRSIIRDLRAARDAAEAGSRAKTEFLANMSHEIRTPLNAIVAVGGLLCDMRLDEQAQSFAEIIRTSSKTLLELINSVLDFSKIESEKLELESQPFAIGECVTSAVELVSSQASEKALTISTEIDASCPPAIFGDVTRVRQILANLLSNAVKFTEVGSIVVRASSRSVPPDATDEAEVEVFFEVRDSGIGIPAEKQAKIFDVFSQADASTTRRFGGTGLGLTISRRLTELMGGSISVESEPGQGSTFRFSIRGRPARLSQMPDAALQLDTELATKMPMRILVAEDHPTNQIVARLLLERMGYEPDVVDNGRQAVDAVAAAIDSGNPYDVVLMDVHMPVLDGLAATREILERWEHERPKIAAVTASTLKGDRERCLAAGVDEFLGKPIFADELEAMLKLMGGYRDAAAAAGPQSEPSKGVDDGTEDEVPVIDASFLDNLVLLGDDQAHDLTDSYLSSARETLSRLEAAADQEDRTTIGSASHRLKGASGIFGARRLEAICERLERASEDRNREQLLTDVAELRREFESVETQLLERLKTA